MAAEETPAKKRSSNRTFFTPNVAHNTRFLIFSIARFLFTYEQPLAGKALAVFGHVYFLSGDTIKNSGRIMQVRRHLGRYSKICRTMSMLWRFSNPGCICPGHLERAVDGRKQVSFDNYVSSAVINSVSTWARESFPTHIFYRYTVFASVRA